MYQAKKPLLQIRMRAQRLGLTDAPVKLAAETNLRDIITTLENERPDIADYRFCTNHVG